MWVAFLPVALVPLWQDEHAWPATVAWSNRAGFHAVVAWQLSQLAVVWTWVAVLPVAVVPLWQLAQVPSTSVWLTLVASFQVVVL